MNQYFDWCGQSDASLENRLLYSHRLREMRAH